MTIPAAFDRALIAFVVLLVGTTAVRIAALLINGLDLYFDEAQYWAWSRSFDWGYFSKPPMVAWVIAATTAIFGDAEWAVRLGAPIAHAIASAAVFALARSIYGAWPAFCAGIGWLLLPGVFFSSSIISTDAVLLPLWAIALFGVWRLMETRAWAWAAVVGVFLGLGVLAKYAMFYFVLCTALAAWWLPPMREALGRGRGLLIALLSLIIIAPNLIWNAQHGFATARHTASNARFDITDMFNPDEVLEFVGDQMGVLGPLIFLALLWAFWRAARRPAVLTQEDKFLLAYIVPPFVFVTLIAFISRANANWAAVAYPASMIWITGTLFASRNGKRVLFGATALNIVLGLSVAYIIYAVPSIANTWKGVRTAQHWEATADEIATRAALRPGEAPFTAVLVDDRTTYYELNYYWRELRREGAPLPPVRMWLLHGDARNSAEATNPMRVEEGARVLVVHLRPDYLPFVADDFTVFRTVERLRVDLGGGRQRELEISVGEGFAPAPRDAAFEERLRMGGR